MRPASRIEYPTLALLAACYLTWGLATAGAETIGLLPAILIAGLATTLHSSLQHEAIHGHPFRDQRLNDLVVFPCLALTVPYERFRDMHLRHHHDPDLTDPFDDPESAYLAPETWARQRTWVKTLLRANNTLLGRIVLGPLIGSYLFWRDDIRAAMAGDRTIPRAWAFHLVQLAPVVIWLAWVGTMPLWSILAAAWIGHGVLKIRVFLEHRAHAQPRGRTAIVEDRGPLALLFLNNNLHAVHHAHPRIAWYRLPEIYRAGRPHFLKRNHGYRYGSYGEVFRHHLFRAKEPVAHPLMPGGEALPERVTVPEAQPRPGRRPA